MFTGLIEETGRIKALNKEGSNITFSISAKRVLEDVKIGDLPRQGDCPLIGALIWSRC